MRFLLGAILVCLAAPVQAQDSEKDTASEPIDRVRELKEWKQEFFHGDLKRIIKRTPDPFRRWSDGSVSYVGRVVWERGQEGYTPSTEDKQIDVVLGGFVVQEVWENGVKIQTPNAGVAYVSGMTGLGLRRYSKNLMLKRTGIYNYETVLGSVWRLPKFEYGEPISEKEYLNSLDRTVVPQSPATTSATNASVQK